MKENKEQDEANKKMSNAVNILIKSVELAQSKGAYNLKEAVIINGAIETLTGKQTEGS